MLTKQSVATYMRYDGDIDSFARVGTSKEHKLISSDDWALIDSFLDDIGLANKGLLSDDYLRKHEANMLANCENSEVIDRLKQLAAKAEPSEKKGLVKSLMGWLFNSKS